MSIKLPYLRVTDIGGYIRYHLCDRRFKLKHNNYELAKELPFSELIFSSSLDPALQLPGRLRENGWEESLQDECYTHLTLTAQKTGQNSNTSWGTFIQILQNLSPGQIAYGREIFLQES
ncbi:hypothetical protein [Nostoc sp. CCY 9925]|uniref:hypothetical protein n=1 Tax=Nostoc sp. CCY 9925 TaxID=3103865 RepID=UPI0039C5E4D6